MLVGIALKAVLAATERATVHPANRGGPTDGQATSGSCLRLDRDAEGECRRRRSHWDPRMNVTGQGLEQRLLDQGLSTPEQQPRKRAAG